MRPTRSVTAVVLTVGGLVLSAGAVAAQTATANPDLRGFPTGPSCAAGTLTGTVRASVDARTLTDRATIVVQLRWNTGGSAYEETAVASTQILFPKAGTSTYGYSLSTANVPVSAKNLVAYAIAKDGSTTRDTLRSKVLATSFCAAETSATTRASSVSIECSGDVVSGSAALVDPPTSGTVPATLVLQGRAAGTTTWSALAKQSYVVGTTTTSLPYELSIAGKHTAEYRVSVRVNNGAAVLSPVVGDATCTPDEVVPEAPVAEPVP